MAILQAVPDSTALPLWADNVGIGTSTPSQKLVVDAGAGNMINSAFINSSMTSGQSNFIEIGQSLSSNNSAEVAFSYTGAGSSLNRMALGFYNNPSLMNLLANGNVGIGTATPGKLLDLSGNSAASYQTVRVTNAAVTGNAPASFDVANGIGVAGYYAAYDSSVYIGASSNSDLNLVTNNSTRAVVTSSGNVGIGTASPGSDRLAIADLSTLGIYLGSSSRSWIGTRNGARLELGANGGTPGSGGFGGVVIDPTAGNVGVGTTAPTTPLEVKGTIYANSGSLVSRIDANTASNGGGAVTLQNFTKSNGQGWTLYNMGSNYGNGLQLWEYPATAPRVTFAEGGNVGVGTTAPVSPLQINNSFSTFGSGGYPINKPVGALIGVPAGAAGSVVTGLMLDSYQDTAFDKGIAIEMGFGIPTYGHYTSRIVHYGNITNSVGTRLQLQTHTTTGDTWNTGIVINETGNVGIGTTNPAIKLDVRGDSYFMNNLNGVFPTYSSIPGTSSSLGSGTIITWNGSSATQGETDFINFPSAGYGGFQFYQGTNTGTVGADPLMIIAANGNVGIGTTNPVNTLEISRSQNGGVTTRVTNGSNGTSAFSSVSATNDSGNAVSISMYGSGNTSSWLGSTWANWGFVGGSSGTSGLMIHSGSGPLELSANGVRAMRIDSSGNVGIGTASPGAKLEINDENNSSLTIKEANVNDGAVIRGYRSRGTITSPSQALTGDTLASLRGFTYNGSAYVRSSGIDLLNTENSAASATGSAISFQTTLNGTSTFTERMRIDHNGNVGIGTASPGSKLHIESSSPERIYLKGNTGGSLPAVTAALVLEGNVDGRGRGMYLSSTAGEANSAWFVGAPYNTPGSFQIGNSSVQDWNAVNSSAYIANAKLFITAAGNVGIGTTNPSFQLDVRGGSSQFSSGGAPIYLNSTNSNTFKISLSDNGTPRGYIGASSTEALSIGSSAGTPLFSVLNGGNVGIGTTSPVDLLTIQKGSSADMLHLQTVSGSGQYAGIRFEGGSGTWDLAAIRGIDSGSNNGDLVFLTDGDNTNNHNVTEKMRILANGNVGIGTSSPDQPLTISGSWGWTGNFAIANILDSGSKGAGLSLSSSGTGGRNWAVYSSANGASIGGGNFAIYDQTAGSNRFVINSSGNVGVGTTSPLTGFHVIANYFSAGHEGTISFFDSTSTVDGGWARGIGFGMNGAEHVRMGAIGNRTSGVDSFDSFYIGVNKSSASPWADGTFVIKANGNVGIGTTSPTQKVTIEGTSVSSSASQTNISAFVNNGLRVNGSVTSSSQDALTYQSGGNGGAAAVAFGRGSSYDTFISFYTNPSGGTTTGANSERVRIDSNGNVGIGTTNPQAALDVVGVIKANKSGSSAAWMMLNGDETAYSETQYVTANNGSTYWRLLALGDSYPTNSGSFQIRRGASSVFMAIQPTGNVGIGTASPSNPLTVVGSPSFNPAANDKAALSTTASSFGGGLLLRDGTYNGGIWTDGNGAVLKLAAGGTSSGFSTVGISITSAGNVGIGTASPTNFAGWNVLELKASSGNTGATFRVSNNVGDQNMVQTDSSGDMVIGTSAGPNLSTSTVNLYANGGPRLTVTPTGNVGIGTTTPGAPLTVATGPGQFASGISIKPSTHVTSRRSSILLDDWNVGQDLVGDGTKDFYIWQGGTGLARFVIDISGNVGVGTASPTEKLHIYGGGQAIRIEDSGTVGNVALLTVDPVSGPLWSHTLTHRENQLITASQQD